MKKIFSILSLGILFSSNFLPSISYAAGDIDGLAKQILTQELGNIGDVLNNEYESGNNLTSTLENNNLKLTKNTNNVKMSDQLKSINFTRNEIVVPDPTNINSGFIIMDRNLGATKAGTGEGSYGYFYQRGNNYGFASTGVVDSTTELATWNNSYSHSGYYNNKFINTSRSYYWSDNDLHTDLWGGENDNSDNYYGFNIINETLNNRQGPCPEGWHVPSIGEWSKLVNYWFDYNHKNGYHLYPNRLYRYRGNYGLSHLEGDIAPRLIVNDLLIPWAGQRYSPSYSDYQNQDYGYGYYWSSTPGIYLYINKSGFDPDQSPYKYTNGCSIRCFKNTYDPEIFTITFKTNGGYKYENKLVPEGNKLILDTDPMKFGSTFEGWFKDEELSEPFDFNTPITENFTLYAKWNNSFGTISISDPNNPLSGFTIMDRNLGAKNSGTGDDAFGYYYQWGNNHGFSTIRSYTENLAEWDDSYNNKGYYGTQFIYTNSNYWADGQLHQGLRGGENDNSDNNYGFNIINETVNNRQGPCPDGYHIPSAGERSKLVEYRKASYNYDNNTVLNMDDDKDKKKALDFIDYFELPLQDYYEPTTDSDDNKSMRLFNLGSPAYGHYRSSTPSTIHAYSLNVSKNGIYPTNIFPKYRGHNIRCFSNNYTVSDEKYTLTLYTNSGGFVDTREIRGNHKLTGLPNITREHSVFEGWYEDKNFTEKNYNFNEIVNKDLTFYAKWSCDFGYQMSDDGQSCEPISVKFNANGGKFSNNENTIIKSSYLKEIEPEIKEIIHTSNVLDDGTQSGVYSANNRVDVVTIPGAKKLHIILKWGFELESNEGMRVWSGSHPDYSPESHSDTAIKFDEGKTRLYGTKLKTEDFEIDGDSVSFGIKTNASPYVGIQYGYHATVIKEAEYVVDFEDGILNNIEQPKRPGYDFIGWYYSGTNEEYNPNIINTGAIVNVKAKWKSIEEKMQETPSTNVGYTNDTTVSIDNELNDEVINSLTTISLVTKEVEDNEVVTGDEKVLVQNTEIQVTADKTVEYQGGLEVYLEKTENEVTERIEGTAKFSSPIAVKIPVSNGMEKVKVKVKHGNEEFGFKGLTLNPENECNNGEAVNYKYNGEEIITTGDDTSKYALIYTCSASTFVAYTENTKPVNNIVNTSSPAAGGGRTITSTRQETKITEQEHNSANINKEVEDVKSSQTKDNSTIEEQVRKLHQRSLTRGEVAVMTDILLDVYPQLVEGKQEIDDIANACSNYADEQKFTKDEKKAITRLCKLSIMGIHADNNEPLDEFLVNERTKNDEFSKVINRSISTYNEKDFSTIKDALKKLENNEENVEFGTVYNVFMSIKNIFN